jgi:ACS family hexuronate transporter-like MFS transporter
MALRLSDSQGWTVNAARKWTIVLGGLIMAPLLVASAFAADPLAAVLLIAVALFGYQIVINNIQTLPSDFFSGKSVGTLAGLGGTSAVAGVLITTWMVPVIRGRAMRSSSRQPCWCRSGR